ncbi:MAG: PilZ domain-containing protein [Gammaproteobacteria bacterium]
MKVRVVDNDAGGEVASRYQTRNLITRLAYKSERYMTELRIIEERYPSVAAYLTLLERKIELLARHAVGETADLPHAPTHEVNLSPDAMRFTHEAQLQKRARIEIELRLFPADVCLLLYARVLWCKQLGSAPRDWTVVAEFEHMDEAEREALAKHIHSLQLDRLRRG